MSGGVFVTEEMRSGGFFDYEIPSAEKASAVILNGAITAAKSSLVHNGDDIITDYTVHPEQILKGSPSAEITVEVHGGKIEFDNGNSAEIKSPLTEHFKVGDSYFLFLSETANTKNIYALVGADQMVFNTSTQDSIVPLAKFSQSRHYSILDSVENNTLMTVNDLVQQVKAAMAERKRH